MTDPGSSPADRPAREPRRLASRRHGGSWPTWPTWPICGSTAAGLDGVVLVTLDLPDRRNMMSAAMTDSWGRAMAVLRADPERAGRGGDRRGHGVLLRR